MKKVSLVLWFCLLLVSSFLGESKEEGHGVYIVYMGAKGSSNDHIQLMSSLTTRYMTSFVRIFFSEILLYEKKSLFSEMITVIKKFDND